MPIRGGNLKPQVGKEMNAQENESSVIYLKLNKQIQTNSLVSQHRKFPSLSIYGGFLIVLTLSVLVLLMTFQK